MKKLFLVVVLLSSIITPTFPSGAIAPELEYRQATEYDVDGILLLINEFDDADNRKLAIPPAVAREAWLLDEIQKNRFFVVYDPAEEDTNPIVGFCKIYIVESENILNVIGEELGAIEPDRFDFKMRKPHSKDLYKITGTQVDDFKHKLSPTKKAPPYQLQPHDVYIYLGTNYTKPSHRGRGINTLLEQSAFELIREDVIAALTAQSAIYYIFGIVEENWGKQARLRSFAKFALSLLPRVRRSTPTYISLTAFNTVKPTLIIDSTHTMPGVPTSPRVIMSPRLSHIPRVGVPGFGCFLGFQIRPRYQTIISG